MAYIQPVFKQYSDSIRNIEFEYIHTEFSMLPSLATPNHEYMPFNELFQIIYFIGE